MGTPAWTHPTFESKFLRATKRSKRSRDHIASEKLIADITTYRQFSADEWMIGCQNWSAEVSCDCLAREYCGLEPCRRVGEGAAEPVPMKNDPTDLERDAEFAVLDAMAIVKRAGQSPNSETVPAEAARLLKESKGLTMTSEQARTCISAAVERLRASGDLYAPVNPKIFWRRPKA